MFGLNSIGPTELILVLAIVVIVFGVGKLPDIGGALGKAIGDFKRAQREVGDSVEAAKEGIKEIKGEIEEVVKSEDLKNT